jgi:hypothetical protein
MRHEIFANNAKQVFLRSVDDSNGAEELRRIPKRIWLSLQSNDIHVATGAYIDLIKIGESNIRNLLSHKIRAVVA